MSEFHVISRLLNQFLDNLFFGFALTTIFALITYLFFKTKLIYNFIYHSIRVARVLAIIYLILYLVSTISYYHSSDFEFFSKRATGPYAWAYWLMLLRPFIFCGLIQLFWLKNVRSKMRYVGLLMIPISIATLFSGAMFEKLVIINSSYHRSVFSEDSQFESEMLLIVASHIIETCILFCALVFISWAIRREPKLK
ncbi:hypothetical protein [uncultured Psychroserpens sp.]|uniref:hypothetical protein n=1 Tax=uncultured Psychroserpens sp. TaxID=255436 RepID=UPI00261B08C5|nr:hypothetical protein [uncultured Psychroserpens sp.]